jgi:Cu/Ag efflux protein CusF
MKNTLMTLALGSVLLAASAFATAQPMDANMSDVAGAQQDSKPTVAQGIGIIKAINMTKGTVTLAHEAIPSIGWPAMASMELKVASTDLLKDAKIGEKVKFTLQTSDTATTVTSITPIQS